MSREKSLRQSASQIFTQAAKDLVQERGIDPNTPKGQEICTEVERHYESSLMNTARHSEAGYVEVNLEKVAQNTVEGVNRSIWPWLDQQKASIGQP